MYAQLGALRSISVSCWHLPHSISLLSILLWTYSLSSIFHYYYFPFNLACVDVFPRTLFYCGFCGIITMHISITNVPRLSSYPPNYHPPPLPPCALYNINITFLDANFSRFQLFWTTQCSITFIDPFSIPFPVSMGIFPYYLASTQQLLLVNR